MSISRDDPATAAGQFHIVALIVPWVLGLAVFWDMTWMSTAFIPAAYLALGLSLLSAGRRWHDWINPLSLILLAGGIRFGIPGLLAAAGVEPDIPAFHQMRLGPAEWLLGHALALLGLLGVTIGWYLPGRFAAAVARAVLRRVRTHLTDGVRIVALAGMLIGCAGLVLFVASNAPIVDVVRTGEFRRTDVQVGTGKYFYMSLMLIASSVVLSADLVRRRRAWWLALVPVLFAALLFWALGGRVRAVTPLAAGLLLLWCDRHSVTFSMRSAGALTVALLPLVLYIGQLYRGGFGLEGLTQALTWPAFLDYVGGAVWVDWGQLHALAGAAAIGPGTLGGASFFLNMLWPISQLFSLGGRSAGVFITETLVGFAGGKKWGFHASLIGDAYLNFGLAGVLIGAALFGFALKTLYVQMKRGAVSAPFYVLAVIYAARMFFEAVDKFIEASAVMVFVVLVIRAGAILTASRRPAIAHGPLRAVPD